jgi:hypothetical protein
VNWLYIAGYEICNFVLSYSGYPIANTIQLKILFPHRIVKNTVLHVQLQ